MKNLNLHLGDFKKHDLLFYGGGFDKVNVITGMKGGGKSHITKGIISESLQAGMSSVVFDINNEYGKLPHSLILKPGDNLKFRLDYMGVETIFRMFQRLAPFPEKTAYAAEAKIPKLIAERKKEVDPNNAKEKRIPDIEFFKSSVNKVITSQKGGGDYMKEAYIRSLEILESYNLIMKESEALKENGTIKEGKAPPVMSLRTAFANMLLGHPQVLIFQIGGLPSAHQKVIVNLVIDHLKETCDDQTKAHQEYLENEQSEKGRKQNKKQTFPVSVPSYPTVFFEEAHMYMDARDIDDLVPLIRHIGINVFFVTNTPGALPESVFRLLDNLIMTRMVNRKDIDRVADCGLTDKETIVGFAQNLKEHHALFLSGKEGATKNFPLVFHVRNFGLPESGQTRSQWKAMKENQKSRENGDSSNQNRQPPPQTNKVATTSAKYSVGDDEVDF